MRIFKNAWFGRFARKEKISPDVLLEAVDRAEKGLVDADLGGGVIKQRIARPGEGKSKGYRSIVLYRRGDKSFLCMVFRKVILAISETMKQSSSSVRPSWCLPCQTNKFAC